jgi:aminoglycoside phosphotransferase family enzyme
MARRIALADKVAALRDPRCYPEATRTVLAIETHMSWVFLTDEHAYKLKKPVHLDHQDFRSLRRRRFYCQEEVRLNRRLAESVYLGVVPLVVCADAVLRLGGAGRAVDWVVRMRRLRAECMLDSLLLQRKVTQAQMRAVGSRLALFHRALPPAPLDGPGYRALLSRHISDCERELCDPAWALPQARIAALLAQQRAVLAACGDAIDGRVAAGLVVEGHGDLRPEHVYLGEPPAIIDCLEFSRELRFLDGLDEVGFLALECERARAAPMAAALLEAYRESSGDPMPQALLHFHQSCRACARARLAIRHLREPRYRASPAWRRRALRYLALAARHLRASQAALTPAVL